MGFVDIQRKVIPDILHRKILTDTPKLFIRPFKVFVHDVVTLYVRQRLDENRKRPNVFRLGEVCQA